MGNSSNKFFKMLAAFKRILKSKDNDPMAIAAMVFLGMSVPSCLMLIVIGLFFLMDDGRLGGDESVVLVIFVPVIAFVLIGFLFLYIYTNQLELEEYADGNWEYDIDEYFEYCRKHFIDERNNWKLAGEYVQKLMDSEEVPSKCQSYYLHEKVLKERYLEGKKHFDVDSVEFYQKCVGKAINSDNLDSSEFRIIVKNSGFDIDRAKAMFRNGRRIVKVLDKAEAEEMAKQAAQEEMNMFEEQKKAALSVSKDIYLKPIIEKYKILKNRYDSVKREEEDALDRAFGVRANTHNSAFWGGVADGLGGLGAGLLTAYQTEQENKNAQKTAEAQRRLWVNSHAIAQNKRIKLEGVKKRLETHIDSIKAAMIDDEDVKSKFEKLNMTCKFGGVTEYGMMELLVRTKYNKDDVKLFNQPAIVDGSVKVNIFKGEKVIGEAYLSNMFYDFDKVSSCSSELGFDSSYSIFGKVDGKIDYTQEDEYTFEIEPIKIWYMEKFEKYSNIGFDEIDRMFN